jgi:hypothetical protein
MRYIFCWYDASSPNDRWAPFVCVSWASAADRASTHLEREENRVRLAPEADDGRTLLNSLERILDLMQAALGREDRVVRVVRVPELIGRV